MNSFERIYATLKRERTDRVAVIPEVAAVTSTLAGGTVRDYVTDGEVIARRQLDARDRFDYDAVIAFADLCVEAEAIGCKTVFPENNYPHISVPVINGADDIDGLVLPDPYKSGRMPQLIKAVSLMKENCAGRVPVVAHVLGPMTIAARIMDIEKLLYMIVDEPHNFRKLLNFTLKVTITFMEALIDAGADCIIMFNPAASPAVLPANIFREFELPNLKQIFSLLKKKDEKIMSWYSVAGATQDVIEDVGQAPVDILTIDYLVPLDVAYSLSPALVFNGNIKSLSFVNERAEDIYGESAALIESSLEEGRFILGSGCEVPPDSRAENIEALVRAAKDASRRTRIYGNAGKGMKEVTFYPYGKKVYAAEGENLMHLAAKVGIQISRLCNKSGACGTCLVRIDKGKSSALTKTELIRLDEEDKRENMRLACQVSVEGDIEVYVPFSSRILNKKIFARKDISRDAINTMLYEFGEPFSLIACSRKFFMPAANEEKTDLEIFKALAGENVSLKPEQLGQMSDFIKDEKKEQFCIIDEERKAVLDFSSSSAIYGAAIDIGTTNIAAYIHDMVTGELLTCGAVVNPQAAFGDNVMKRSEEYMKSHDKRNKLVHALFKGVNHLLLELTRGADLDFNSIFRVVIVGNAVMHHMFFDLRLDNLVRAPFIPVTDEPCFYVNGEREEAMRLAVNRQAAIYLPPLMGGFAGSDVAVGIIATGMHRSDKITLFIDMGTNGEIALGNRKRLIVTSAAAGPAFEYSFASAGGAAASGIVYEVDIDEKFNAHFKTFDGQSPTGMCGSAVVDTIASLLKLNLLDERGRFIDNADCPHLTDEGYTVVPRQQTSYFKPLVMTAKDVEEIQKAKGGIRASVSLLLKEYGIEAKDLDKVVLTGAFGVTMKAANVILIGLIPPVAEEKVEFLQNGAGLGARLCLMAKDAAGDVEKLAERIEYVNVARSSEFNDIFIDALFFN
ncbi:MAG: ASKHA domain-containing protein [Deltaproteobacteria bacterium]|nr:ASKHA domain-containing protein [Deltaproteobacteria bacterium]